LGERREFNGRGVDFDEWRGRSAPRITPPLSIPGASCPTASAASASRRVVFRLGEHHLVDDHGCIGSEDDAINETFRDRPCLRFGDATHVDIRRFMRIAAVSSTCARQPPRIQCPPPAAVRRDGAEAEASTNWHCEDSSILDVVMCASI
jgi:hypothetical protein